MFLLIGLILDAAIIGVILIAVTGEFPGWGTVIGCVLAVGIVANAIAALLPWPASLFGLVAGAAVGAWVIAWVTSIDFRRALKVAGIYIAVRAVLTLVLVQLFR